MDQNASANVQATQPNPAPAPQAEAANGTNVTTPAGEATTGATQTTDPGAGVADSKPSFDPEIQKFLDNQNIKTDDLAAAVSELAKRNMKLRGNQSETQSVAEVLNPKPTAPEKPVEQSQEPAIKPAEPQTSQPHNLSDMDIATVSLYVKQQYPGVTTDAEFYKSMIADGFRPTTADGQINLKSVLSYAAYQQKLADANKVIAENQPKANQIPQPSNQPEYAQVDQVQTMTEQAAQNIVLFSNTEKRYGRPVHPQYDAAVKFLQDLARK
ncbi:MAG: hypothetical protein IIY21_25360 [Clostridiales bacterium]|nr:hypothetical protein [Clostridiales bacterium]